MRDPYEILEIGKHASMDEIKAAYKRQVKKYHPDKYQNNPLADLAQEKLKEINEAYDYLCQHHTGGGNQGGSGYAGRHSQSSAGRSSEFAEVREYIDRGNLQAAETILNRSSVRNAEWFFLRGMTAYKKGWHDEAVSNIQQAVSMEPNNYEYRRTLDTIGQQGGTFRNAAYGRGYNSNEDMMCRMCQCYLCTDLMCDCI